MEAVEALQPDLYVTMSDEVWGWYERSVVVLLDWAPSTWDSSISPSPPPHMGRCAPARQRPPPSPTKLPVQIVAEANRKKARASVDRTVKVGEGGGGHFLGHFLCHSIWEAQQGGISVSDTLFQQRCSREVVVASFPVVLLCIALSCFIMHALCLSP